MATILPEPSRTFGEYLLIPRLTTAACVPENVDVSAPITKFGRGETPALTLNIPFVSAIMQSVSNDAMGIALARAGGLAFIYCSQPIDHQVETVKRVKKHKAGFVVSDANLAETATLRDVLGVKQRTGHSTIAITADATEEGRLLGLVGSRDYSTSTALDTPVSELMTPFAKLICGREGLSLSEANTMLRGHRLDVLPVVDRDQRLRYLVFRKDYDAHKQNPSELLDGDKRLRVGAGINTRDYRDRVPALVDAGADVLCLDSSDGFSVWQSEAIEFIRKRYGDAVKVGAGNIVDGHAFHYLADAGADFIKVGIGGGAICITREQKGIGRGQASSLIDVCAARDEYFERTGTYVPICSDGGIVHDYHMIIAHALGADFLMMGRYFARFDESPSKLVKLGSTYYKEYWGEGSNRARNWQRYDMGATKPNTEAFLFEEGVDSYVPYAGKLRDTLDVSLAKLKSTMCNCGSTTLKSFSRDSILTLVSGLSLREGGTHDVLLRSEELASLP